MAPIQIQDSIGMADPPREREASVLESLLHRRDRTTGRFVELETEDRQLYFAFIGERD